MKWLRMKSVSLEDVTEVEDLECPSTAAGIELVSFAPLERQNGFCMHDTSDDDEDGDLDVDSDTLVTRV